MKTSTKWILGIVAGLIVVGVLVVVAVLALNFSGTADWVYGVRMGRLWDNTRFIPFQDIPMRPGLRVQDAQFYSNFPWGVAGIIGLFCLCPVLLIVMIVVGLFALLRRPSRQEPPTPPPPVPHVEPAPFVDEKEKREAETKEEPIEAAEPPGDIEQPPSESGTCPYCGREVQPDWSHCAYCGAGLGK